LPKCKLEILLNGCSHLSKQNQKTPKWLELETLAHLGNQQSENLFASRTQKMFPQTSNEHNSTPDSNYLEFECKYDFHAPSSTFVKTSCHLLHFNLCIVETHGFKFQTLTIKIQKG